MGTKFIKMTTKALQILLISSLMIGNLNLSVFAEETTTSTTVDTSGANTTTTTVSSVASFVTTVNTSDTTSVADTTGATTETTVSVPTTTNVPVDTTVAVPVTTNASETTPTSEESTQATQTTQVNRMARNNVPTEAQAEEYKITLTSETMFGKNMTFKTLTTDENGVLNSADAINNFYYMPKGQGFVKWQVMDENGSLVDAQFPMTFSQDTTLYPYYEDLFFVNSYDQKNADSSKAIVTWELTPNANINIPGYTFVVSYATESNGVYTRSLTKEVNGTYNQTVLLYTNGNIASSYNYSYALTGIVVAEKYTVIAHDLEGGVLKSIEVDKNATEWISQFPTTLDNLAEGVNFEGWYHEWNEAGEQYLVASNTAARVDNGIIEPGISYDITINYVDNKNVNQVVTAKTHVDVVTDPHLFDTHYLPVSTNSNYAYEWTINGSVVSVEDIGFIDFKQPTTITGKLVEVKEDLEVAQMPTMEKASVYTGNALIITAEEIAKHVNNQGYRTVRASDIKIEAPVSGWPTDVVNVNNPGSEIKTISDLGVVTVKYEVTFIDAGVQTNFWGEVKLMVLPQVVQINRYTTHITPMGDDTLVNYEYSSIKTPMQVSYVAGVPTNVAGMSHELMALMSKNPGINQFSIDSSQPLINGSMVALEFKDGITLNELKSGTYASRDIYTATLIGGNRSNIFLLDEATSQYYVFGYKSEAQTKVYDGQPFEVKASDSVFAQSEALFEKYSKGTSHVMSLSFWNNAETEFNLASFVTGTDVDTYEVPYKYLTVDSSDAATKNTSNSATATVIIEQRPIVISGLNLNKTTPNTTDFVYEVEGVDRGLLNGHRIVSVDVDGEQLVPGTSEYTVANAKIEDADGNDVTHNYAISYEPGTLLNSGTNIIPTTPDTTTTAPVVTTTVAPATTTVAPTTESTTEETTITEQSTPEAGTTVAVIEDDVTPESGSGAAWALVNLIASIIGMLTAIFLILSKTKKEEEEDENATDEQEVLKRRKTWKVVSAFTAIVSMIVFVLTEDMTLPMILVDRWTLLMLVFTGINIVSLVYGRKFHEEEKEEVNKA